MAKNKINYKELPFGSYDYDKNIILINKNRSSARKIYIFIHEFLHYFIYFFPGTWRAPLHEFIDKMYKRCTKQKMYEKLIKHKWTREIISYIGYVRIFKRLY